MKHSSHFLTVALAGAVLCLFAVAVPAQSGRRLPNSKPAATPTPEVEPTRPTRKPAEKDESAIKVVVGMDRGNAFDNVPMSFYSTALYACTDRLDESPSVKVLATYSDFTRAGAVSRAKKEQDTYVVYLQLRRENMASDRDVYLEYAVFAPTTGKQVTAGVSYQQAARVGGVVVGPGSSGGNVVYGEHLIKQAGKDAAERILSGLHVPTSRPTLPY